MATARATKTVRYNFVDDANPDTLVHVSVAIKPTPGQYPNQGTNTYLGYAVVSGSVSVLPQSGPSTKFSIPSSSPWWGQQVLWSAANTPDGGSMDGIQTLDILTSDGGHWGTLNWNSGESFSISVGDPPFYTLDMTLIHTTWPPA
jgi:hypothetical protein